jgi:polyketide biosynthesis enoyl-CoA hydratase PksH
MDYKTIIVKESDWGLTITLNRPQQRNSLNRILLNEVNQVFAGAEKNSQCRIVIVEGQPGIFCSGQDFEEVADQSGGNEPTPAKASSNPYLETLKRFTTTSKIVISVVDGQAMAGGVGLAAASDLVIATPRSQFALSEALWGLLPAIVMPFLIRRVGFQVAYRMALTTMPVSALEAYEAHLVDEVSETPRESIRRWGLRLSRLDEITITKMKQLARLINPIDEDVENQMVSYSLERFSDPQTIQKISNYIKYKKFPWET